MAQERITIRLPQFDGDAGKFQVWWMRFRAYATMNKFVQAIGKTQEADLPAQEDAVLDVTQAAEKRQDEARKRNFQAMASYTMAFTTNGLMGMVYKARTVNWPSGIAAKVTEALFNRYQPVDVLTTMEIKRALFGVRIEPKQNPRILFERLQAINNKFEGRVSDEDMLATAISSAPTQYAATIAAEEIRQGDALTLDDLEKAMKMHWRINGGTSGEQSTNEELTLVDASSEGNTKYQARRSNKKCNLCGRIGHFYKDCWFNPANKDKRPDWLKAKLAGEETSAALIESQDDDDYDDGVVELILCSIEKKEQSSGERALTEQPVELCGQNPNEEAEPDEDGLNERSYGEQLSGERAPTEQQSELPRATESDSRLQQSEADQANERNKNGQTPERMTNCVVPTTGTPKDHNMSCVAPGKKSNNKCGYAIKRKTEEKKQRTIVQQAPDSSKRTYNERIKREQEIQICMLHSDAPMAEQLAHIHQLHEWIQPDVTKDDKVPEDDSKAPQAKTKKSESDGEFGLSMTFPDDTGILQHPNIWIGDTGATNHTTPFEHGVVNVTRPDNSDLTSCAFGSKDMPAKIGDIPVEIFDKNGMFMAKSKLTSVAVQKKGDFNLFSLTRAIKEGWTLGGNKTCIWLEKDGMTLKFDIRITTPRGMVFCIYLRRTSKGEMSAAAIKMGIKKAHDQLGHADEDRTRAMAKYLGWDITRGTLGPCLSCAVGKAKRKNLHDSESRKATTPGERLYLDIATIKEKAGMPKVGKPHMRIIVDEATAKYFLHFFKKKNEMIEPTCELFHQWQEEDKKKIKYLRMDGAGENKKLAKRLRSVDWKINPSIEYTARDTPQQNHLAEIGLTVLINRARAMMHRANLPLNLRYTLASEALKTAALLNGLNIVTNHEGDEAPKDVMWNGKLPAFAKYLRTWGEAGVVKLKNLATPKIADRGKQCMFIGYAEQHAGDCYRMWNPKTRGVHESRDVIWLNRMFYPNTNEEEESIEVSLPVDGNVDTYDPEETEEEITENDAITTIVESQEDEEEDEDNQAATEELSEPDEDEEKEDDEDEEKEDDEEEENDDDEDNEQPTDEQLIENQYLISDREPVGSSTRGRNLRTVERYGNEMANVLEAGCNTTLREVLIQHYEQEDGLVEELAMVGLGDGQGFTDTTELRPMTYDEAMKTKDKEAWEDAVNEEHTKMEKYKVCTSNLQNAIAACLHPYKVFFSSSRQSFG